jgi:hypothetical protein
MDETPLVGGNLTSVVRVGASVRHAQGPWSPAVHALLRHLGWAAAGDGVAQRMIVEGHLTNYEQGLATLRHHRPALELRLTRP